MDSRLSTLAWPAPGQSPLVHLLLYLYLQCLCLGPCLSSVFSSLNCYCYCCCCLCCCCFLTTTQLFNYLI
ncbi:MAG: hypothetical protein JOS17DRAFT_538639 [Linnemannia elongata]|nr:MAG: hypothetical protein JOS17DRAFT_538639 [Linnemannia elongata]